MRSDDSVLTWKPANFEHPSLGWVARTKHDEIDVEIRATPGVTAPGYCPCWPAECSQFGIPAVMVTATAFMPMVTIGCGHHVDIAEYGDDLHAPGGTEGKPGDVVNKFAAGLLPEVTAEARRALAELAGHAARLGITPVTGESQ